ncbi:hypothetical protein GCM10011352_09740 [Marinobacterium zhoushanense]|uniref:DUF403 domain-containing protein n=1 Tax=Marinobacterium zhoushanense TaxID=1679163 RepID=A0ABQ1K3D7_9GAMM|nr:circularly permuted type 2 ATP-grasp protein [Marinobacterium zhoushanense]GGB85917.1 hypothetical protein GCM10011352_09740 [Marinobacterium zhoushanense]
MATQLSADTPEMVLNYPRPDTFYDEVYGANGDTRQHWRYLLDGLGSLGADGLRERQRKAQRILRDDGATYNIATAGLGSRTWGLDPVPLLIDSEEWSRIEAGLIERAELLDLVLKDLYGPRELIRHRVLPPELIYSNQGFLRACQGVQIPGEKQLVLHAVDMVRGTDGNMVVIGDRTQAPSGAGYALENRSVMSRVLPSLFRDSQVHRLSLFFQALRRKMASLSPNGDSPRVVILTPGAYSETYFEHTYLANYLGYSLVQGGDLTVRNGYVWMKSLDGLHRVDIILRRVDDTWCDPVELRSDSHLGVPGLLEVARAGNVVIANPLGSGVLENPALLKFLPQIAEFFLGHDLALQSTQTWWLGDPDDRDYVLANLNKLIVKPTTRRSGEHSVYCADLTPEELDEVKRRICDDPIHYVAQQTNLPGSSPSWQQQELLPRATVLRSFAVADQSAYSVMPGGLTRVASSTEQAIVSNQLGATSKDTWVLASEPQRRVSFFDERQPSYREDQTSDLPSRVVENLFWLGRYSERAEAAMRLMRTVFIQLNSPAPLPEAVRDLLLKAVTQVTTTYPGFTAEDAPLDQPENELLSVILEPSRAGGITSNLQAMLNCSEETKEMLSADTHRVINDLRDELESLPQFLGSGLAAAPEEALDPLVTTLLALSGLTQESMIRGFGWRFLEMGRRLERTLQSTALLRSLLVPVLDDSDQEQVVETVLLTTEVLITYRRRYRTRPMLNHGLTLIMLDKTNPRSLHYQIDLLRQHIEQLQSRERSPVLSDEHRSVLEALTLVQLSRPDELANSDDEGVREALDERLARIQTLLCTAANAISDRYFDHRSGPQQLVQTGWSEEP